MRLAALGVALALAACGPKHATTSLFEEDDPRAGGQPESEPEPELASAQVAGEQHNVVRGWDARSVAPAGKGERTGTIDRTKLLATLDAGPGAFLRQLEVAASMDGDNFVGWQLVQIVDDATALLQLDLIAGDVLVAVNGAPIARPDQLMTVWNSLRTSDRLVCDVLRGDNRFQLSFAIVPPIGRVPPDMTPPPTPPVTLPPKK
jgi:hypothetical protein